MVARRSFHFRWTNDDGGGREGVDSFAQSANNSKAKKKLECVNSLFVVDENFSNDDTNGGVMSIIMSGSSIAAVVYDRLQVYLGKLHYLFPFVGPTA